MKKRFLTLAIAIGLVGCGGGSSGSKPGASIPPAGNFVAYNGFSVVKPGQVVNVDLRNYVEGGDSILSLTSDNKECVVPDVDQMNFSVKFDAGAYCLYDYVVKNSAEQTQSATITLLSTSADDPILPAITKSANVGSADLRFDIAALLGADWKSSYSLNADSVSVIADIKSLAGKAYPNGNTIIFDAPLTGGSNRILYTLSDSADSDMERLGTIYITLSENITDAPNISDLNYTYPNSVIASQTEIIDVSNLPGLTISDNGDWQLIDVQSFSSNVELVAPESVTNKQFSFTSPTLGEHVVSYTVTDHMGSFSVGLIAINVSPNEPDKSWTDITITSRGGEATYTATPQYSDANNKGLDVKPYWDVGVSNTVAAFNALQGSVYCSEFGSVPKVSELQQMYVYGITGNTVSGDFSALPKELRYLVRDDEDLSYLAFELSDGNIGVLAADERIYVTCLQSSQLELVTLTSNLVANGDDHLLLKVNKPANSVVIPDVLLSSGARLTLDDVNVTVTPTSATSDDILVSSSVIGRFKIKVTIDGEELISPEFTAVPDGSSATVSSLSYDTHDANSDPYVLADGVSTLKATATIEDANNNIVSDALVIFDALGSPDISDDQGGFHVTNQDGQVELDFVSNTEVDFNTDPYEKTFSYDLIVNGAPETFNFKIKHANYYDELELSDLTDQGRYMTAVLKVKSRAGVYRAATIEVSGGKRGSIIYAPGQNPGSYVTQLNIPETGLLIWVSMARDNIAGSFDFELTGSPTQASIQIPATYKGLLSLSSAAEMTNGQDFDDETLLLYLLDSNADITEIFYMSSSHGRNIYLPQLNDNTDLGRIIVVQNATSDNTLHMWRRDGTSYDVVQGDPHGAHTCPRIGVFWTGTDWDMMHEDLVPNMESPSMQNPHCVNSVDPD